MNLVLYFIVFVYVIQKLNEAYLTQIADASFNLIIKPIFSSITIIYVVPVLFPISVSQHNWLLVVIPIRLCFVYS